MNNPPKIGIVFCAYNVAEYLEASIKPWIELRKEYPILISMVHAQFREMYELGFPDNDRETLEMLLHNKYEDYLYIANNYWMNKPENYIYEDEATVRNHALTPLLENNIEYLWLWDGDEIADIEELKKTIDFIQKDEFIAWYRTEYRNLTFSENQYTTGFRPPRIFKANYGNCKLSKFYWDNDVLYVNKDTKQDIDYKLLPSCDVPRAKFFAKHYTWLNNERSKNKILYQEKHFSNGAGCAFKWGDRGLEWNKKYFELTKQSTPELYET